MRIRRCFVSFLLIFSAPAFAQECKQQNIYVSVAEANGKPVADLTENNFRLRIDTTNIRIAEFTQGEIPRRIVLVLDVSDSMRDFLSQPLRTGAAIDRFVELAPPGMQIGAVIFNQQTEIIPFTSDKAGLSLSLSQAIKKLTSGRVGYTALFDAVQIAHRNMKLEAGDVIYAVTDGGDQKSKARPDDVRNSAIAAGIRFFAVYPQPPDSFVEAEEFVGPAFLQETTRRSGGTLLIALPIQEEKRLGALEAVPPFQVSAQNFFELMFHPYRLSFELPADFSPDQTVKVEVVDGEGKKRNGVLVLAPTQMRRCTSQSK